MLNTKSYVSSGIVEETKRYVTRAKLWACKAIKTLLVHREATLILLNALPQR